jgi:GntR family transcriptional regulator
MISVTDRLPLYVQVKEWLQGRIVAGEWDHGQAIPSERDLAAKLSVNRLTVRQAIQELADQGVLVRKHGVGTFVRRPVTSQILLKFGSFSEDMRSLGQDAESRLVDFSTGSADGPTAAGLSIAPGDRTTHVTRLRVLDGSPIMVSISVLPTARCPITRDDVASGSLYQALRRINREPVRTEQTIGALRAGSAYGRLLGVGPGEPLVHVEGIGYDAGDEPVEFYRNYAVADRIRFSVRLHRQA